MATTKWVLDPAHSEVQFKVKHLMITTVTGHFRKFDLQVETDDDDFTKAKSVVFTSEIDSVDTNNAQRDTHIKSADFFSAEEYRHIKFIGKKLEKKADDKYVLTGDLTIRDTTKPITLDVEFGGIVTDPWGQTKAGFTVDGKIKRKDYGVAWDAVTEAGQVVASNEVRIHCEIQLIKQAVPAAADDKKSEKEITV
ncbi:MAG: polyisoprenoid-binding protein [Bacteroidetes bacterium]|jgi:polyisoprenoid-binding protein YceI|nr:MAG: polyisoprenoid-binding protein [Bacteroidota bacterium]